MNFSALNTPPSSQQIADYIRSVDTNSHYSDRAIARLSGQSKSYTTPLIIIFVSIFACGLILVGIGTISVQTLATITFAATLPLIFFFMVVQFASLSDDATKISWRQSTQLELFARSNGFTHRRGGKLTLPDDSVVQRMSGQFTVIDAVAFDDAEIFVVTHQQAAPLSFMRISLPVSIPHMVLMSKFSPILPDLAGSGMPLGTATEPVLLEGNFNDRFSLNAAPKSQTIARYFFTPDLMASLLDNGHGYDLETTGSAIYLYIPAFDWHNLNGWKHLFTIKEQIINEIKRDASAYIADI